MVRGSPEPSFWPDPRAPIQFLIFTEPIPDPRKVACRACTPVNAYFINIILPKAKNHFNLQLTKHFTQHSCIIILIFIN